MSKSPTKDVIDLSYIFDEDFMNLFNGKENIFGTNTEFLCKQKKKDYCGSFLQQTDTILIN